MMSNFYRFNFFSLVKWTLVFLAAMFGRQHAKEVPVWKGKKEMKRPFRKAFWLLLIASIAGIAQMNFQHKFYKQMRKLRDSDEVSPYQDFSIEEPLVEEDPEIVYLNANEHGRNLRESIHHNKELREGDWDRRS